MPREKFVAEGYGVIKGHRKYGAPEHEIDIHARMRNVPPQFDGMVNDRREVKVTIEWEEEQENTVEMKKKIEQLERNVRCLETDKEALQKKLEKMRRAVRDLKDEC